MTKLKEYLEEAKIAKDTSLALPSSNALANVIAKELIASPLVQISNTEASEFSHKVSELATSAEVINELSDEIGVPKSYETEDEFVKRAKSTLTSILKRKLSK
ncbi:hypothetical protein AL345_09630 [Aeromonas caviae]|jgi:hypothetical protein|uniref:Uncharacterized protein n=1 Tax=Aeromonas caviae TaxID=648 RepID=A0A7T3X108_AERCA|nr:hypothetical protein [Aeromonas caviae]KOG94496.1 hypothetical protein AL345_09630 [Aeromonas caviae]MEB5776397.1 hypothetical protein [Aeromonas caviae]MEB6651625.1 hypothetical protein [Aeromonas caviae]QQA60071.1 hypothetical protein JC965_17935 [Aeromonas caviae]